MNKNKKLKIINNYKEKIQKYNNKIWLPNIKLKYKPIKTNSWFDISKGTSTKNHKLQFKQKNKFKDCIIKCKKIRVNLTEYQKKILNNWFNSYIMMYNETLKLIKTRYSSNKKTILDFKILRTKYLKNIKTNIMNFYSNKKVCIHSHNLDYAIKLACSNYKSALSNFKQGNIKHFRIRYWRHNKLNKIIDIEKDRINKKGICYNKLGKLTLTYNKKNYKLDDIMNDCRLQYNLLDNKYYLYVPQTIKCISNNNSNVVLSCDPGIRTFITGLSENHAIKIGDKCFSNIKQKIKQIDKINNSPLKQSIKHKKEKQLKRKIHNMIDDLHWKTINYMTHNYKNILIGDMSIKSILNNKSSCLTKLTKRILLQYRFYIFKQRLEYKCNLYKINYRLIDESYTSKICSNCSNIKEDLGSSKIYKCTNCSKIIDRDINGARGILIKSF